MKKVYVSMIADTLHAGHIRILENAAKHGEVIVGLLTKEACEEINDIAYLSYKDRETVLKLIPYVSKIIPQTTANGIDNLLLENIFTVVHGSNWKTGNLSRIRTEVLAYLHSIENGELIEIHYYDKIGNVQIKEEMNQGTTPVSRLNSLAYLLKENRPIKILEVHSPISGLIAEKITHYKEGFDGMWSSSLTDSTSRGKPDNESVESSSRLRIINEIFEVTSKPMIYDGDTGGKPEHFPFLVKNLERIGVSAVIIEDKCGLKKNSLFGTDVFQEQDTIENFAHKISIGKASQVTKNFMIIARVESLILGKTIDDAMERSLAYVEAGADAIMIHSKEKSGDDILEFLRLFRKVNSYIPIVVIPTSYNHLTATKLYESGANIIIYANHMLRSAYPAMVKTATSILMHGKSEYADNDYCMPIKEILELIPGTK
jgi:phosphoenolpyruvate phosphomutase